MTTPSGPTVFVVDDYAPGRTSISRLLRTAGFAVAAFASAKEFLGHYDPQTPGCLVLDPAMPDMSGLELQSVVPGKGNLLRIIFLTSPGAIAKSVKGMKHGARYLLTA